jgi:hypothetical protein
MFRISYLILLHTSTKGYPLKKKINSTMRLNNLSYYYIQECVEDTTQKRLSSFSPLPHTNTIKSLQNIADFLLSLADLLRRSAAAAKSLLAALRRMRVAKFFAMSGPFG